MTEEKNLVTLTIDGRAVSVPKGTNLVEAARTVGIEVPHYCYHPHLSIAGNCRMCQVEVKGRPKLEIGCNTSVTEGMEVSTHLTSKAVEDAQAATLEFILINHPLDCTVCDQAGHCKLQDYHFEYNARPSRFLEAKEKKVKAVPLGPTVMLDGERCIMCTRCVRFCDEVTGTSELGMLNRGDRSVIAVNDDRPLANPLSGTVVDLCPVGALTHREWRFNTRIWFTQQNDGVCPGCSTGCNVKVAERDGEIVQVKARLNSAVNKEWLCDEGRYGFMRFLPKERVDSVRMDGKEAGLELALQTLSRMKPSETVVFVAPDLTLEDMAVLKKLVTSKWSGATVVVQYQERRLTDLEAILISPDYAPNFRGAEWLGLVAGDLEKSYREALTKVASGAFANVLVLGDRGVLPEDVTSEFIAGAKLLSGVLTDAAHPLASRAHLLIPGRSILEKSGLLINRGIRLQYTNKVVNFPDASHPEWRVLGALGTLLGERMPDVRADRECTLWLLGSHDRLSGLTIKDIKEGGIDLARYRPAASSLDGQEGRM